MRVPLILRRVTLKRGQLVRARHPTDTFRDLYMCALRNGIAVIIGRALNINDARERLGIGLKQARSAIGTKMPPTEFR